LSDEHRVRGVGVVPGREKMPGADRGAATFVDPALSISGPTIPKARAALPSAPPPDALVPIVGIQFL